MTDARDARNLTADAVLYGLGVTFGIHAAGLRDTPTVFAMGLTMTLVFALIAWLLRVMHRAWNSAFSGTIEGNSSAWGILHGPDGIRIAFGRRVWRP